MLMTSYSNDIGTIWISTILMLIEVNHLLQALIQFVVFWCGWVLFVHFAVLSNTLLQSALPPWCLYFGTELCIFVCNDFLVAFNKQMG